MHAIRAAQRVVVTPDGDGVVSHVGSLLVAELADRLGFTEALSEGMVETVVAPGGTIRGRSSPTWR